MDLQFKSVPFEIKAADGDGSVGRGLGSVFFNVDSYNEIVDDEAFNDDLAEFLENGFVGGINHLWDQPIGKPTAAKAVREGLDVTWKLSPTAHGKDVMILLKDGVIKRLSIGFRTLGSKLLETFDEVQDYWKTKDYTPNSDDIARAQGGATLLTRIKLFEISPVVVPANSLAVITAVKAAYDAASKVYSDSSIINERTETDPNEAERLVKIRSIAARAEAEDILRNAGLSRTESAAFISAVKALPRNAASDEADPAPPEPDEVVPDEGKADQPEPTPEVPPTDSETLPESDTPAPDPVIVTPVPTDTPEPIAAPPTDEPKGFEFALDEFDPLAQELRKAKDRSARNIAQRQAELDAEFARLVSRSAGA